MNRPLADYNSRQMRLPKKLSKSVLVLSCKSSTAPDGVCYVYVLGTHHLSKKSQREAKALISFIKPEVVFLECCPKSSKRFLTTKNLEVPTENSLIGKLKKHETLLRALRNWRMDKAISKIDEITGLEFRVAYQEAKKYGCKVVLGDRPKELKDGDLLNHQVGIFCKEFPIVIETMVHERDQYMSSLLLKHARKSKSVVAVVGMGHLKGIMKYWKKPVAKDLLTVPTPKPGRATRLWNMLNNTRMFRLLQLLIGEFMKKDRETYQL